MQKEVETGEKPESFPEKDAQYLRIEKGGEQYGP